MTEVFIRDSASTVLSELADVLDRLADKLSPALLARVSDTIEASIDLVERTSELTQVITCKLDPVATSAGDYVANVKVTDRCRDLVTALCAFDRDLELVCKTHGFLAGQSSLVTAGAQSCTEAQDGDLLSTLESSSGRVVD